MYSASNNIIYHDQHCSVYSQVETGEIEPNDLSLQKCANAMRRRYAAPKHDYQTRRKDAQEKARLITQAGCGETKSHCTDNQHTKKGKGIETDQNNRMETSRTMR